MTSAWLELLLQRKEFHPSIVFVVEEILPSYQNWRFNNPIEKETFGQKVLKVCSMHHDHCYWHPWDLTKKIVPNVRFMSYSKCSNWCWILKLAWNFGCLFMFFYSAVANLLKTKLQTCTLQTGQLQICKSVLIELSPSK